MWQNAPTSPTSQAWMLYDGEGHRVEQYVSGGSGNHTYYLPGNVEEVTPSGSLIKYYAAGGLSLGENTATTASGISYLASDGLGSVSEALNQTGTATGSVLYGPYGGVRYTTGTMPTTKGFTGQYSDASTGLDYYGARYYDPTLGQFTSADTVGGLNRYGYVAGNPETATDPTGHRIWTGGFDSSVGNLCPPPPKLSGVSELATAAGVLKAARELQLKLSVTQKRLAVWEARVAYQDIKDAYRLAHGAGSIPHSVRRPGAKSVSDSNDDLNSKLEETEGDVYALNHGVGTALIGVGAGMDGALAGHQQWIEDDGKYGFVQHVLRAGVADIAHSLFSTAVAATGAAIGGFFGLVVGAAVGGIIGGVAGLIAGSTVAPGLGTVGGAMAGIDVGVETGGDIGLVGGASWRNNTFQRTFRASRWSHKLLRIVDSLNWRTCMRGS